jgi:hypothetical protein
MPPQGEVMPVSVVDIVTGLFTAVISGTCVWLWQRGSRLRRLRRKATFFGLRGGKECLVVINHHWQTPKTIAREDVYALLDIGNLAEELGCKLVVRSATEHVAGVAGGRTEFCIGGPDSNPRTGAHLAAFLPGAHFRPYSEVQESVELVVGPQRFIRDPDKIEYALVARFTPTGGTHPIFLICGQTAITNRAAIHHLKTNYDHLSRTLPTNFCLIIKVTAPEVYGHELVSLEANVSDTAFVAQSGIEA